jgi:hypothetical protein
MWDLIHNISGKTVHDTSIINMQYKIVHRIIACNYYLKICKIRNNDICDFCNEIDTIEHFFVKCKISHDFWQQVLKWWAINIGIWFDIDTYEIVFGIPNERDENLVNQLNFYILFGKYYIYNQKKKEKPLILFEFLKDCRKQIESKRDILFRTGGEKKFKDRWGELHECLM